MSSIYTHIYRVHHGRYTQYNVYAMYYMGTDDLSVCLI